MSRPSDELVELCGAVRDEIATPGQIARLEVILVNDADARRFYRRFTQVSALLERYEQLPPATGTGSRQQRPESPAQRPALAGSGAASTLPPSNRKVRSYRRVGYWLAFAAGLALLMFAAVGLSTRTMEEASPDATPAAAARTPIAMIHEWHATTLIPGVGDPTPVNGLVQLHEGDIIATAASGSAVIRFPDEATLFILAANTRVWLARERGSKIVHLTAGQLYGDVAKQRPGEQWRVLTSDGEAKILGTQFAVSTRHEGTRVAVTSGRVQVISRDSRQEVETRAGFAAQVTPTTAILTRLPPTVPTRIVSFTLMDPATNAAIPGFEALTSGAILDLAKLPTRRLNIRANCEPQLVGSVRFALTSAEISEQMLKRSAQNARSFPHQIEMYYPYMLAGDPSVLGERLPDHSYYWEPPVGRYTLTAVPYAMVRDAGARGEKLTIEFEVVDSSAGRR